jgi:ATP-dependent DNA helicase RecG
MYHPKDVFEKPEEYLDFILSQDFEGQFFERKEIVTDINRVNQSLRDVKEGLTATISAFANYNQTGGLIVIGINDKTKEVTGLEHLNDNQFQNLLTFNNLRNVNLIPKSFYIGKKLLKLIYVPYLEHDICETADRQQAAYKRMGNRNQILTELDKQQILRDKRVGSWENSILDAEFHLEDTDASVAESFKRGYLKNSDYEVSFSEILKQIGAVREQNGTLYWTNAGILFFDKSPQRMLPQASVRFVRYDFLLKDQPHMSLTSYDKTFSYAPLPVLLQKIREFAKSPFFRQFVVRNADGHLQEFDQFPSDALEESIINAMVHRDYATTTTIWCKLYLDAFVAENAGRILQPDRQVPETFDLGSYQLVPNPRNPRLVEWIKMLQTSEGKPFVKNIAEGTRKMKDLMQKMYFPYPKYKTNGTTSATLQAVSSPDELENLLKNYWQHSQINLSILNAQNIEQVEAELDKLRKKTQDDREKLQLSFNLAVQKAPDFEKAKAFFYEMTASDIPVNEISYNTLINKSEKFEELKFFFEEFLKKFLFQKGNPRTEKNYNFLLAALFKKIIRKEDWEWVKSEIQKLHEKGFRMDDYTRNFYDNLEKKYPLF